MKRYDEKILHVLMDKYERSLLYTGQNKRNQTIRFSVNKSTIPAYFDVSSQEYSIIHMQLLELEKKGYISLIWKNRKAGHILESCVLNLEKAEEIYRFLNRKPKRNNEEHILEICRSFTSKNAVLDCFLTEIRERIAEQKSVKQYFDPSHPEELEQCCQLILTILENQEELFLREFSVRYRSDSKAIGKEISKAVNIIVRFSQQKELFGLSWEQVLEEFHIYKNPSWVMLKGQGCFRMGETGKILSLKDFPDGIGVSSRDIGQIRWLQDDTPERILTIENLTSFHRWQEDGLVIYLGGYHNSTKRNFLQRIYKAYPHAVYAHFGDLDCGGFLIWKDLCEKTGISFAPQNMDEITYLQFLDYGQPLTDRDKKELRRMMQDPFFVQQNLLFNLMLEKGIKVEQEAISLKGR